MVGWFGNGAGTVAGPNPAIEQRASERRTDPAIDPDTHNLHAGIGQCCLICDRLIVPGQPVRRTVSGGYVHDNC
jgi:hypothetical protein